MSKLCFHNSYRNEYVLEGQCYGYEIFLTLCEFALDGYQTKNNVLVSSFDADFVTGNDSLYVVCPEGHFTYNFLSCDKASRCGAANLPLRCKTQPKSSGSSIVTEMFLCSDQTRTLHYTLVCDFKQDCNDGSDEMFCTRSQTCDGYQCQNGQCIPLDKLCDVENDCWDASDEDCDQFQEWYVSLTNHIDPPAVINFEKDGNLTYKALSVFESCPETHFRCPPDGYCLPVYVRCNGVYDCPNREDEANCQVYTCPGFYRCRASTVCVHIDHMCDGRPQCPQHDDELFCDLRCPQGCVCQGLAFLCSETFDMQNVPALRYLDARGSGLSTKDLSPTIYLAWLSLAACNLQVLYNISLPTLQTLDLSDNLISWLDMSYFMRFENLRVLRLAGNPLQFLFTSYTEPQHSPLTYLDLSRTLLKVFTGEMLSSFSAIQVLNLSISCLTELRYDSFYYIQDVTHLDLSKTQIRRVHNDTFKHLKSLKVLQASSYKLCCHELLPDLAHEVMCFSPDDIFSSCQNLLRSKTVFAFFWALCVVSLTGNVYCIVHSEIKKKEKHRSVFNVLMINLHVSDFLTGTYMLVIGVADVVYRDRYLWYEEAWTGGWLCQMSGLVFWVCVDVSIITLTAIIAERLIVVRSPLDFSLHGKSLVTICCIIWLLALVFAVLPILCTWQWQFYGQNSVCLPLPVFEKDYKGWDYVFVLMLFRLVLTLVAGVCHAFSVCTLHPSEISAVMALKSEEMALARRVTVLIVTKILSSLVTSVFGVMSETAAVIAGVLILFVHTINASLNPWLYIVNVFLKERRDSAKGRIVKVLRSRLRVSQKCV
ncbi:G-protein coupled receptor GRL101-like [Pomacea canaliculata]|uniref:G-protein coupled receptor GRL101-like n=1 Tax=Pomacea canaliculata TaxID=400727 RepID=UPI000D72C658|nr:G-protein coupled receptor GRL101-like [Pomacea canaliculata]